MALILRGDLDRKVTAQELDANFVYLESISGGSASVGPTGPQGATGPQGIQGPTGPQGPTGSGSSCALTKCQETVQYGFVDIDLALDNVFAGSASYFTASLVRNSFVGGEPFQGELTGQYINQTTEPFPGVSVINTVVNGILLPPVEQGGGIMYPVIGFNFRQDSEVIGTQQEQYSLNIAFIDIKYQYSKQQNGTASIDFQHTMNFTDSFEGIGGKLEILATTDITETTITGFTYALYEGVFATVSM